MENNIRVSAILVLLVTIWSTTPLSAKEVFLECDGQSKRCIKVAGTPQCEDSTKEKHVIAFEGKTIKHENDGGGFLSFKASCEASDALITCVEPIESGPIDSQFAESGVRTLNLSRVTGKLDWGYESTFGPQHRSRKKLEARGWLNTYDAQCTLRENKALF
jgi:hypothetical protein